MTQTNVTHNFLNKMYNSCKYVLDLRCHEISTGCANILKIQLLRTRAATSTCTKDLGFINRDYFFRACRFSRHFEDTEDNLKAGLAIAAKADKTNC